MCNYCSKGSEWFVYTTSKVFATEVCTKHLPEAIKYKHDNAKSTDPVLVEAMNT